MDRRNQLSTAHSTRSHQQHDSDCCPFPPHSPSPPTCQCHSSIPPYHGHLHKESSIPVNICGCGRRQVPADSNSQPRAQPPAEGFLALHGLQGKPVVTTLTLGLSVKCSYYMAKSGSVACKADFKSSPKTYLWVSKETSRAGR